MNSIITATFEVTILHSSCCYIYSLLELSRTNLSHQASLLRLASTCIAWIETTVSDIVTMSQPG